MTDTWPSIKWCRVRDTDFWLHSAKFRGGLLLTKTREKWRDYILRPANRPSCASCMDEYASVIQWMNGRAIWLRSILGMTTKTKLIVWHKTHKQWQRMSEVLARGLCINTVTHNAECWSTDSIVTVDSNSIKRESTESRRQYSVSLRNESKTYNTSENKPARVEDDRHQTNIPHATHGTCTANVIRTSRAGFCSGSSCQCLAQTGAMISVDNLADRNT